MTINLAWKFNGVAFLVADSVYTSQKSPAVPLTSFGEPTLAGGLTRSEEAAKLVRLNDETVVSFRGDVERALVYLRALARDLGAASQTNTPVDLGVMLTSAFDRTFVRDIQIEATAGFGLHIARVFQKRVELWSFESIEPNRPRFVEDLATMRAADCGRPEVLERHILIAGSAVEGDVRAVSPVAALLSIAGHYPGWIAAAAAAWVMVTNHFQQLIERGVGGHVAGVAVTSEGIEWMGDTRVVILPANPERFLTGGPDRRAPLDGEVEGDALQGHILVDILVRDGVVMTYSTSTLGTVWVPHLSEDWIEVWLREWRPRLNEERKKVYPELWVVIEPSRGNVAFVTPAEESEPSLVLHKRGSDELFWTSPRLREVLRAVGDGRRVSWFPDLKPRADEGWSG